jgi:hypothetical protein
MAPAPVEHADKVATPAPEASAARVNCLRVITAQRLNYDDRQPSSSWTARQIGVWNELRHTPISVEHSLSIQPDNNQRRSDKK